MYMVKKEKESKSLTIKPRDHGLVRLFNEADVVDIVLYLLDHPEGSTRQDFRNDPLKKQYIIINRVLDSLFDQGIVKFSGHPSHPKVSLTEKGKIVAENLSIVFQNVEDYEKYKDLP
jgi:predicted methyltransferase